MPMTAAFLFPHPPLLIPEIGKGAERRVAATADACDECARLIAALKPDVIMLCSPHAPILADEFYICPSHEKLDHGAFVPLYFVNRHCGDYTLLRVSPSLLPLITHYEFGRETARGMDAKNAVFIASGDLSHKLKSDGPYGFAEEGVMFDETVTKAIAGGNLDSLLNIGGELREQAAECGLAPLAMLTGVISEMNATPKLRSYENTFGVGYAVASFIKE